MYIIVNNYYIHTVNLWKYVVKFFILNNVMNTSLEKRFGAKLAYIRKSKKLSQMKLAEMVDMNFNYIGQIERGEANVTIKTIKVLADALEVEAKSFFDFVF